MSTKSLKFREHLLPSILSGEKTVTWRLFDDKNISVGDVVDLINWDTKEQFGEATVISVREKQLGAIVDSDWEGQERFASDEEMYATYRRYYGDGVGPETVVKIIGFKLA